MRSEEARAGYRFQGIPWILTQVSGPPPPPSTSACTPTDVGTRPESFIGMTRFTGMRLPRAAPSSPRAIAANRWQKPQIRKELKEIRPRREKECAQTGGALTKGLPSPSVIC